MALEVGGSNPLIHPISFLHFRGSVELRNGSDYIVTDGLVLPLVMDSFTGCHIVDPYARVAELADALDLGSSGVTRGGSTPPFRIVSLYTSPQEYDLGDFFIHTLH